MNVAVGAARRFYKIEFERRQTCWHRYKDMHWNERRRVETHSGVKEPKIANASFDDSVYWSL